jgi:hypothetical protein
MTAAPAPAGSPAESPAGAPGDGTADELATLRAEVAGLRAQLARRRRRQVTVTGLRAVLAGVLAACAAVALVAAVVGVWAANTTLNTDRWVATVAPLPKDPRVAAAMSTYTTNEIFRLVDVEHRLRQALPDRAAFLAAPVTGEVRSYVARTVTGLLQTDAFQRIWVAANRRAHVQALSILEGHSQVVTVHGSRVTINLLPLVNQALRAISARLPTLFGHKLSLPDLGSGQLPANLRALVSRALGVTLPADFAQITLYDSGRLRALQLGLVRFKRDVVLLALLALVLLAAALAVSPHRRRTVVQLGLWLMVAAVAVTATVRVSIRQLVGQVPPGVYRDGVAAAVGIVGATLRDRGVQLLWLGGLVALVAYLVGPGRLPRLLRRGVRTGTTSAVRGVRHGTRPALRRVAGFTARHRDPIRVAGVLVAVVLALLLGSWWALLVVAVGLAGYELAVTAVARRDHHEGMRPGGTGRSDMEPGTADATSGAQWGRS